MAETRRKEEKGKKEPRSKARALRPGEARGLRPGEARGLRPGELMIGDVVWSEITGRLAKVVALDEGAAVVGTMSEAFMVPCDEVRTVAITGEVLGLLGFEENRVIGVYYLEEPTEVNVGELYDGRWSVDAYEGDSLNKVMEGHVVRYVHELQHVLRVFGVESEPRWNLGGKDGTEN